MSDEKKNRVDELMNVGKVSDGNAVDWEARCKELENKLNGAYVEQGRINQLNEKLKEREQRIAELEAKNSNDSLMDGLSEDERSSIPEEVLQATAKMVRKAQDDSDRRYREMEQRREEDAAKDRNRRIEDFVSSRYPNFWSEVGAGGDKNDAWNQYFRYNEASIRGAFGSGDTDMISYHIERFYNDHLGVPVPSAGQSGSAAPDPRTSGGGIGGGQHVSGKTYTQDEFMALYDALEIARDRGDAAEMARLNAEIKSAPAEGRVK